MWRLRIVHQPSAEEHEKLAEEMKLTYPFPSVSVISETL